MFRTRRRHLPITILAVALQPVAAVSVAAQERTDTLIAPDTIAARAGQDTAAADTLPPAQIAVDTLDLLQVFPAFPEVSRNQPGTVRVWPLHDILLNGALTPADLIEHAAPLEPIRVGFLEGPQAFVFGGAGAASLRASVDGYELAPLGGGALDLHSLSLVELGEVRLMREPGGFHLRQQTHRRDRDEPYSRIEGGTGDRDTNMLRGFFSSEFLGMPLGFGFDRFDTDGSPPTGGGQRTSVRANVARQLPLDVWTQLEFRRSTLERDTAAAPQRTDWVIRARRAFGTGWHADVVAGTATRIEESAAVADPDDPDAMPADIELTARQLALRGARTSPHYRAQLVLRFWDGVGLPRFAPEAMLELDRGPLALFTHGRYTDGRDRDLLAGYAGARLALPLGLHATGEIESGRRGRYGDAGADAISFDRWTVGGGIEQLGWRLEAHGGRWRVSPSPGLGLPFDSAASLPGGRLGVFEASARGRVLRLFGGEIIAGGLYRAREGGAVLYWPLDEWRLEGRYHVLLYGGQLELDLLTLGGIRGPMRVVDRTAGPGAMALTPEQSWLWAEARVRIRDVYIYYTYEVVDAAGVPFDVPGFPLPRARTHFGLRWEFWN